MDKLYSEAEAAPLILLTEKQLKRKRVDGKISCTKMKRGVYGYTEAHLIEYRLANEVKRCAENPNLSGSNALTEASNPPAGISSIMTESEAELRQRAVASARKTMKPRSSSPSGFSNGNALQPESRTSLW